jgi:hypothetical protein
MVILLVTILLMAIGSYYINGYFIGDDFINGYW